ncbi:hypothetical protein ABVT39_005191, partial [Epinephelus coioides]
LIKKLLYCEMVPGSQPWSSELHSDTCCSLTTTEKGDHFNQDIKTGNEMDRGGTSGGGGGGQERRWSSTECPKVKNEERREERIEGYSLALCPDAVLCPSPSLS